MSDTYIEHIFYGMSNVEVRLPDSLVTIGDYTLEGCTVVFNDELPNLEYIGNKSLCGATINSNQGSDYICFSERLEYIGDSALQATNIRAFWLPNSVAFVYDSFGKAIVSSSRDLTNKDAYPDINLGDVSFKQLSDRYEFISYLNK